MRPAVWKPWRPDSPTRCAGTQATHSARNGSSSRTPCSGNGYACSSQTTSVWPLTCASNCPPNSHGRRCVKPCLGCPRSLSSSPRICVGEFSSAWVGGPATTRSAATSATANRASVSNWRTVWRLPTTAASSIGRRRSAIGRRARNPLGTPGYGPPWSPTKPPPCIGSMPSLLTGMPFNPRKTPALARPGRG